MDHSYCWAFSWVYVSYSLFEGGGLYCRVFYRIIIFTLHSTFRQLAGPVQVISLVVSPPLVLQDLISHPPPTSQDAPAAPGARAKRQERQERRQPSEVQGLY
jgi:hypothetical protein